MLRVAFEVLQVSDEMLYTSMESTGTAATPKVLDLYSRHDAEDSFTQFH